jgi:hypothetical protein
MARTVGDTVARRLGREHRGPSELVTYPLQQTACPAIVIAAPPISDAQEEIRLNQARYLREQAYAVFLGVLHHFGVADSCSLKIEIRGSEPADWLATLDGTWTLVSDESGVVRFECLPPGPHDVRLRRGPTALQREVVLPSGGTAARIVIDTASPEPAPGR